MHMLKSKVLKCGLSAKAMGKEAIQSQDIKEVYFQNCVINSTFK